VKRKLWQYYPGGDGPGRGKYVVLISGDEEYRSEEALVALGKIVSQRHGFAATVLFPQDPNNPGVINPNYRQNIPGLKALRKADLMIIETRFRTLPDDQMKELEAYLLSGRPVIGLRTATHAFKFPTGLFGLSDNSKWAHWSFDYNGSKSAWKEGFGKLVLGTTWISHHGTHGKESTRGVAAKLPAGSRERDILNGISAGDIWGPTDVYTVPIPLPGDSQVIVYGQVLAGMSKDAEPLGAGPYRWWQRLGINSDFDKNAPMMPVAWTRTYCLPEGKKGKVFGTTMGASMDLAAVGTRRMIVNAVYWALELPIPEHGTNVDIVGAFDPSMYGFKDDEYWLKRHLRVEDFDLKSGSVTP